MRRLTPRLAVFAVLVAGFAVSALAAPFFSDDFESETADGGFPTWDNYVVNPDDQVAVSGAQAFLGTQSLQVNFLANTDGGADAGAYPSYLEKNVVYVASDGGSVTGSTELSVRFYLFIPAGFPLASGNTITVASVTDSEDGGLVDGRFQVDLVGGAVVGVPAVDLTVQDSTGLSPHTIGGVSLTPGAWHYVEAGVSSNLAAGTAWLYVDGQTFNLGPVDTGGFTYASGRIGVTAGSNPAAASWFVDEAAFDVAVIGPICTDAGFPGCAIPPDAGPDAGATDSGGTVSDAGAVDSGAVDSGAVADSGTVVDSGPVVDSGLIVDAGVSDAGAVADAGVGDSGSTCTGCVDGTGACRPGTTTGLCGSGGAACQACSSTETCLGGACTACTGCIDTTGTCQTGTDNTACGSGGAACQVCSAASSQSCINNSCTCAACVDTSGICQSGNTNAACGASGAACAVCTGAQECIAGACAIPSDGGNADSGPGDGGPPINVVVVVTPSSTTAVGASVNLDATGTTGGVAPLTFAWTPVAYPIGNAPTLAQPNVPKTNFTPNVAGDFSFRVLVTDNVGTQAEGFALVTASAPGGGCGCATNNSASPWVAVFMGLAFASRRRRRPL